MKPLPYFPFYPADWLAGRAVTLMSPLQRGLFINLLAHAWTSRVQCVLPEGDDALHKLAGCDLPTWMEHRQPVLDAFETCAGGIRNPKQWRIYQESRRYRKVKSEAGKHGGRPKADAKQNESSEKADAKQEANQTQSEKKPSSSLSSSSSLALKDKEERLSSVPITDPKRDPFTDPSVTDRAGLFCALYQRLYPLHRKGARYTMRPARDYAAAVTLCETWADDSRLEKLAKIFLMTDHDFAESGSRTIPQFLALASWCDGRLAESESGGNAHTPRAKL